MENMKENPFLSQKRERMRKLQDYIKSVKRLEYVALLAFAEIALGTSRQVAIDYVQTLKDFGYIKIDNGVVILNEKEGK